MAGKPAEVVQSQGHGRVGDPCIITIFGASGDLTTRKLLPALYNLRRSEVLSDDFAVLGVAVDDMTEDQFRDKVRSDIREYAGAPADCSVCDWLAERVYYLTGDFRDPQTYERVKQRIAELDERHATHGNYLYYLATAPGFFEEIPTCLGLAGLTEEKDSHWRRVVIENPSAATWIRRAH